MGHIVSEKVKQVEPMITVERGEPIETRLPPIARTFRRPLELVRRMLEWEPFEAMAPMRLWRDEVFVPDFTVKETPTAFVLKADVPGVEPSKLQVKLLGNRLTIAGERTEDAREEGETFYLFERSFGSFTRSFTLPEGADIDKVTAELKEGVLTIVIPRHPEVQPRKVDVQIA